MSSDERNKIFQSVVGKKSGYVRGRGYMAKAPTSVERVRDEFNGKLQHLEKQLEVERAERDKERAERDKERAEKEAELVKALEEESAKRAVEIELLRQTMRQEFMQMLANQN